MYKLKLKHGETTIVRKRGGFQQIIVGGEIYSQEQLEALYNAGHKTLVTKLKDGKETKATSNKDIPNT